MSYINEAQLLQAMKRLYMLGNKPYRSGRGTASPEGEVGSSLGQAFIGLPMQANAAQKANQAQTRNDSNWSNYLDQENQKIQAQRAHKAVFDAARNRQSGQLEAVNAPINGTFSQGGFESHAAQTSKQAMDIQNSKRLMGAGSGIGGAIDPLEDPTFGRGY